MDIDDLKGYILKDGKVVEVPWMEAAIWFETCGLERQIEQTAIKAKPGKYRSLDDDWEYETPPEEFVSTAFLCIDHNFRGGKPILFETMVFGGPLDGRQWRYSSIEDARRGHRKAVAMVQKAHKRKGTNE